MGVKGMLTLTIAFHVLQCNDIVSLKKDKERKDSAKNHLNFFLSLIIFFYCLLLDVCVTFYHKNC